MYVYGSPSPRKDFKDAPKLVKKRRGVCDCYIKIMFGYAFNFQLSEKQVS